MITQPSTKDHPVWNYGEHRPTVNRLWDTRFLLFLEDTTAVFDGFKALDIDALGIEHGELRVIIGPNGAGKTTFCDIITGKTRPTSGTVHFNKEDITEDNESRIALKGIGRKFQTPTVFDSLTTYQNMELALPGNQRMWPNLFAQKSKAESEQIFSLLDRVNLADDADVEARFLSHGQRQWLAISVLLLSEPKLLLIDEPAAGLTDSETELTAQLLLEFNQQHTIVVIEHDMDFVRMLDSRVTVLNEGSVMAEGSLEEVKKNEDVVEAYLGR